MHLSILYKPKCKDRPWLIKRVGGRYDQHAHMCTKKDAEKVRNLIDVGKYPYNKNFKTAMQRLLTEDEMKKLKKKSRYFNSQKGPR